MLLEKAGMLITSDKKTEEILNDYYIAYLSRQLSLLGKREVHNGRAHFGVFGDGKEIAQIAYAKTSVRATGARDITATKLSCLPLALCNPKSFLP